MSRPAVLLDRDGTMVQEIGYLHRIEDLRWFSFTAEAVRLLNRSGFVVAVVTNQGGIGLGLYTEDVMHRLHAHMTGVLALGGARIDGWFFCPHHPNAVTAELRGPCECRKPGAGMIRDAAARLDIDLARSYLIGDKAADLESAARAGVRGVLVRTGYGDQLANEHQGQVPGAAFVAADLMEATAWVLVQHGHPHEPA